MEYTLYIYSIHKKEYLKTTDKEHEFILVTSEDNLFDENEFGLTIEKDYITYEVKNEFFYKITNDNGKDYFYPRYLFKF